MVMTAFYVLTAATLSSILLFVSSLQQSTFQQRISCHQSCSRRLYHSSFCSTRHHATPGVSRLHTLRSKLDDEDDDDDGDNIINLSDPIDFSDLDGKIFDDVPNYGIIRTLETPEYNPIEPVSVEEIELWIQKNKVQEKQQQKKRFWKKVFPWVSPLTTLLLPKRHAPSTTYESLSSSRSKSNAPRKRHSNFSNNGIGSPKMFRDFVTKPNSARNLLVTINIVAFIYQIVTAVYYLPGFNRVLAASVAGDAVSAAALDGGLSNSIPQWTPSEVILRALGLVGGGAGVVIASGSTMRGVRGRVVGRGPIAAHSMGPFFLDFAHQPYPLSHLQRHRYLSSGFLHGSLLHLGMNLRAMLSLPSWLENGIGKGVYLSAYLVAIVTGNIAHTLTTVGDWRASSSLCIGASGGVCGLYGLMLASLLKMGNNNSAYYVAKQMLWLFLYGFLIPGISNAGHFGGFIGGWLIGYLFGPKYERSYTLNKAGGLARDSADWEFRQMMGPGIYPYKDKSIFPLKYLWMAIGAVVVARPDLRSIPLALIQGIIAPGSLSGARSLLR